MTAQAADRETILRERRVYADPVAASQTIYVGAITMIDAATGSLVRGITATGLVMRGIAVAASVSAAAGTILESRHSILARLKNSASTDLIARTEIGTNCYVVDDQTVAKTSGSATRSVCGIVRDIDAASGDVWVEIP